MLQEHRPHFFNVALQPVRARFAHRHEARAVVLGQPHAHEGLFKVEVFDGQRQQLTQAKSRCVERFQDDAITKAERAVQVRRIEQAAHFLGLQQHRRQQLRRFGRRDHRAVIASAAPALMQELHEALQGGQPVDLRVAREALAGLRAHAFKEMALVVGERPRIDIAKREALRFDEPQERLQLLVMVPHAGLVALLQAQP